jgi:N-acetylmuramoyl-L-alanine amidase
MRMRRNPIPVLVLVAAASVWGQSRRGIGEVEVTAVRLWSLTGAARVAVQVSGEFNYRAERAHDPERLYFDILHARPSFGGRRLYRQDTGDPIVKRIRVAETTPGVTRVVLDLEDHAEYTASQLANPDRLMVEVRSAPATSHAPAVTELRPAEVSPEPVRTLSSAVARSATRPEKAEAPPLLPAPPPGVMASGSQGAKASPLKIAAAKPDPPPAADRGNPAVETAADTTTRQVTGKAAKLTADGNNSLIRVLGLKINRVVIDPGHGGNDEGTRGPRGLLEKDLVLDVAKRLGALIEQRMGAEVIYTRTDDTFIPLQQRTAMANDRKADLFLSIHANSSRYPRISGVESYYLNFAASQDAGAMEVAARENAASESSVFDLGDLVQKITRHEKVEESREFATSVQNSLQSFESRSFPQSKARGVKRAPFVVLIGAQMPSVLTEIGFLTNAREESLLKKPDYRQRLAEAIFRGISKYAQNLSHFQMASAGTG